MKRWSPSAQSFFARPQSAGAAIPTAAPALPFDLPPRCPPVSSLPTRSGSRPEAGHKMGMITNDIRAAIAAARPDEIAGRWRAFLCAQYAPGRRAKDIARDFETAVKTAERWLAPDGPAPGATNLMRAALIFGFPALEQVLLPGPAVPAPRATITDLAAKLDQLADQISRIREVTCPPS